MGQELRAKKVRVAEIDIYESVTCSEKIGINCSCFSVEVGSECLRLPVNLGVQ